MPDTKRLELINGVLDLGLAVQLYLDSLMNRGPGAVLTFSLSRGDNSDEKFGVLFKLYSVRTVTEGPQITDWNTEWGYSSLTMMKSIH